jgi:hypothetical protein
MVGDQDAVFERNAVLRLVSIFAGLWRWVT